MTILNIGDQPYESSDIAAKVRSDINFLESRIKLLEAQQKPNTVVLQTYRDMLEGRHAVLDWLSQGAKTAFNQ